MLAAYVQQQEEPPGLGVWHRDTDTVRQLPVPVRPFFGFEVPRWTPDSRSVIVKLTAAAAHGRSSQRPPRLILAVRRRYGCSPSIQSHLRSRSLRQARNRPW